MLRLLSSRPAAVRALPKFARSLATEAEASNMNEVSIENQ